MDNADFRQLVLKGIDPEHRKEVCCCPLSLSHTRDNDDDRKR